MNEEKKPKNTNQIDPNSTPKSKVDADAQTDPNSTSKSKPKGKSQTDPKAKSQSEPKATPKSKVKGKPKAKPKEKKPIGRPKKPIDYAMVDKLAHIHCTQEEIADMVGVGIRTLQNDEEFMRIYKKGMNLGRMSLRRRQFEAANKGNTTMLIWLGKQLLGQKDDAEMNEVRKGELALKQKELELRTMLPTETNLDEYIEALNHNLGNVFADEEITDDLAEELSNDLDE